MTIELQIQGFSSPEKFDPKLSIQCIFASSVAKVGLLWDRFFYLTIFFSPLEMFWIWFLSFTTFLCLDLTLIHTGYALSVSSVDAVLCLRKFSHYFFQHCGPYSLYSLLLKCIYYRSLKMCHTSSSSLLSHFLFIYLFFVYTW